MIIITGSNGQLAQCFKNLNMGLTLFLSREECDITNLQNLKQIIQKYKPEFVINCAAYTAVDLAEKDNEQAYYINKLGPKNLATLSKDFNYKLIHISTDYVFDGKKNTPYEESDLAEPQNFYGKSKLSGELEIMQHTPSYYIIRSSWLYSEFNNNFVKNIYKLLQMKESLNVVNDQIGGPTYAHDLAMAIQAIILSPTHHFGIYHYSNQGICSRFDLAVTIKNYFNLKCQVNPIYSHEYPLLAKRPAYSALSTNKIQNTFGIKIPHFHESLYKCLNNLERISK
jgi:dTDP-4-dehydrorhamnose reductase